MKYIILVLITILSKILFASEFHSNYQIDEIFNKANLEGTFVLYDENANNYTIHNAERAKKRYLPASTFKIANTLIGLKVGAVKSVDEILPYGGKPQFIESWEKDMSLREAIKISNIPIYQELARRIGLEKMKHHITRINYGNNNIGLSVDEFWLKGPLKISAVEQVDFLYRLTKKSFPLPKNVKGTVQEIILREQNNDWKLYGKTGWAMNIGWWVGWVEKKENVYCFALNIDMTDIKDAPKRIELGKKSLKVVGILE